MVSPKTHLAIFILLAVIISGVGCNRTSARKSSEPVAPVLKIAFDLDRLNEAGLYGPPDGLRALSYEFCIPAREDYADEVKAIDPTIDISAGSPGRVDCSEDQFLCMGNTHQKNFREVLLRLAALPYVDRIEESVFEQ
ncbi:MAG: hypothetical protein ACE5GL_05325 [Calditrichia bacterium]